MSTAQKGIRATEKQRELLQQRGVIFQPDITVSEASKLLEQLFDDVLSLADLESFDSSSPSGKTERRFCCPLCGQDKSKDQAHRSLAVNTSTGKWLCHRCQEAGKLKEFWEGSNGGAYRPAKKQNLNFALLQEAKPKSEPTPEDIEKQKYWGGLWDAASLLKNSIAVNYVQKRGIPVDLVEAVGGRFSPRWYGRPAVLFPIRSKRGELVAVSSRFLDGKMEKDETTGELREVFPGNGLKSQTGGAKKEGVFFASSDVLKSPCIAIVEAPFDALALHLCGIASLATIGTSWPTWLPSALAFKNVLLASDNDEAGEAMAAKLGGELRACGAHTFRLLPGLKDWAAELEAKGIEALRDQLRRFASNCEVDSRICASLQEAERGRSKEALFIARLLEYDEGLELRVTIENKINRLVKAVA